MAPADTREERSSQRVNRASESSPYDVSALSEARFHKRVKSGRGALRAFDRAVSRWALAVAADAG
jgi:hypothetical protein